MILSDTNIKFWRDEGSIRIEPWREECLGCNSYDVHLGKTIAIYQDEILDAKRAPEVRYFDIQNDGYVMYPGVLYLGVTEEYTETNRHVPFIDGKSSGGRLGLSIHVTAGRGDIGFSGYFTLEMTVIHPLRVYAGMPVAQLIYFEAGHTQTPYSEKVTAKYNNKDPRPQPSKMYLNFNK